MQLATQNAVMIQFVWEILETASVMYYAVSFQTAAMILMTPVL